MNSSPPRLISRGVTLDEQPLHPTPYHSRQLYQTEGRVQTNCNIKGSASSTTAGNYCADELMRNTTGRNAYTKSLKDFFYKEMVGFFLEDPNILCVYKLEYNACRGSRFLVSHYWACGPHAGS
ncbi:hypothetical protein TNCT_705571 [Trichonephila clavata]|uniref:Uncharacterized protein n=1 Tax=Trichonephila clavata TaxID=2740835 RepID=A0A8X6IH54_TRICU|nr:hypothetical protein TNCT_705571 [Trichonephila clavata]